MIKLILLMGICWFVT